MTKFKIPEIKNEVLRQFAPGSEERKKLLMTIDSMLERAPFKVPIVVDGKEVFNKTIGKQYMPHEHRRVLCEYSQASNEDVSKAIESSLRAKKSWEKLTWSSRASIFLKVAHLLSTKYRFELLAATMLGQGKNLWQAEIDAGAELCDFLRFNVKYGDELMETQPPQNSEGVWNRTEYRPLEGFVYAISPFNFTAIAGNLVVAPVLMGNVALFKPSPFAVYSNYIVYRTLVEAGLPANVIQFLPGDAEKITQVALSHPDFAALHFTGSTFVLKTLWKQITENLMMQNGYKSYPKIVGETGGKNFHLITANVGHVANAAVNSVRAAFEFQGQKCSALSRLYCAKSVWPQFQDELVRRTRELRVGSPIELQHFVGPVIHENSWNKLNNVIQRGRKDPEIEILCGGETDKSKGYFISPTIMLTSNPDHDFMKQEFFGPIVTCFVYEDDQLESLCEKIDTTSEYALTGAIFSQDRAEIEHLCEKLKYSAGNFYINDKCTGAVVGEQPFGGSRASGTNDKAGSAMILNRFVSPRTIKENFGYQTEVLYASNKLI